MSLVAQLLPYLLDRQSQQHSRQGDSGNCREYFSGQPVASDILLSKSKPAAGIQCSSVEIFRHI